MLLSLCDLMATFFAVVGDGTNGGGAGITLFVQSGNVTHACILLLLICVLFRSRLLFPPVWLLMWLCQLLRFFGRVFFSSSFREFNQMKPSVEEQTKSKYRLYWPCVFPDNFASVFRHLNLIRRNSSKIIKFSFEFRHLNLSFGVAAIFFPTIWYAHTILIICTDESSVANKKKTLFRLVRIFPVYSTPIRLVR